MSWPTMKENTLQTIFLNTAYLDGFKDLDFKVGSVWFDPII